MSVKRILFLSYLLISSAVHARPEAHLINGKEIKPDKYIESIRTLKEGDVKLAKVAFELSKEVDSSVNVKNDLNFIKKLSVAVKKASYNSPDPVVRIEALKEVISRDMGLAYDFSDPKAESPANNLLSYTLKTKKGSCLTMPLLYLAVAQELKWPIYPVVVQNHMFLRYVTGGKDINIEATSGSSLPDSWYVEHFKVSKDVIKNGNYMKTSSYTEMAALLLQYNAFYYFKKRNHTKAFEYIDAAIEMYPANPNLVMAKAKMLRDIGDNFFKTGDPEGGEVAFGEAKKYADKAKALGFNQKNETEYLKQMAAYNAAEQDKKIIKPKM